jgi:hypothetical protein
MGELRADDMKSWLRTVWDALEDYREIVICEGHHANDEEWDDICLAMAWISHALLRQRDEIEP